VFKSKENEKLVSQFFEVEGPRCLFFTYRAPLKKNSDGSGYTEMTGAPPEFRVSTGTFASKFYGISILFVNPK
jgi:hypothetical protein